jgi:hypothetical protein
MGEQEAGRGAFPRCRRCGDGDLVPLSDFGPKGGEVRYKAWGCTAPACGGAVKLHRGQIVREAAVGAGTGKGRTRTAPAPARRIPPPRGHAASPGPSTRPE